MFVKAVFVKAVFVKAVIDWLIGRDDVCKLRIPVSLSLSSFSDIKAFSTFL